MTKHELKASSRKHMPRLMPEVLPGCQQHPECLCEPLAACHRRVLEGHTLCPKPLPDQAWPSNARPPMQGRCMFLDSGALLPGKSHLNEVEDKP